MLPTRISIAKVGADQRRIGLNYFSKSKRRFAENFRAPSP